MKTPIHAPKILVADDLVSGTAGIRMPLPAIDTPLADLSTACAAVKIELNGTTFRVFVDTLLHALVPRVSFHITEDADEVFGTISFVPLAT